MKRKMQLQSKPTRGRPALGKKKFKISLSPKAETVSKQKAFSLGIDFCVYVEQLIRRDNPKEFKAILPA